VSVRIRPRVPVTASGGVRFSSLGLGPRARGFESHLADQFASSIKVMHRFVKASKTDRYRPSNPNDGE
jgi:hypothetical protein